MYIESGWKREGKDFIKFANEDILLIQQSNIYIHTYPNIYIYMLYTQAHKNSYNICAYREMFKISESLNKIMFIECERRRVKKKRRI